MRYLPVWETGDVFLHRYCGRPFYHSQTGQLTGSFSILQQLNSLRLFLRRTSSHSELNSVRHIKIASCSVFSASYPQKFQMV
jgi:hypothetical protein